MDRQISPRIDAQCAQRIEQHFPSLNAGATYLLESWWPVYRATLEEMRGRFSRGELGAMLDVSNGLILTPGIAGNHLAADVGDGCTLDGLDRKWGIQRSEVLSKLHASTCAQRAALEIWARAFWESGQDDSEVWIDQLAAPARGAAA